MWRSTISFVNARVATPSGTARSIRFAGHVLGINEPPSRHDVVIDLDGARVLPGLINAHDHLELNHYGRLKFRERHASATEWTDDMRPRLSADPHIVAAKSHRLGHRLLIGGLKNLLSGVTTIAHHNPLYREVGRFCPVHLVRKFGWAHSFALQGEPAGARGESGGDIVERHRATPPDQPFIIHLAEGTGAAAAAEFDALESLGCLTPNTVLVHALALTDDQWHRLDRSGASVIWCPASNEFLFGRTLDVPRLFAEFPNLRARFALATDSRLSGARDLLDEIRVAIAAGISAADAFAMVTTAAAQVLKLGTAGAIACGRPADLIILPPSAGSAAEALATATRADIRLVMAGGRPLVGAPAFESVFKERRIPSEPATVDDRPVLLDASLAGQLRRCAISEPGVELETLRGRGYLLAASR